MTNQFYLAVTAAVLFGFWGGYMFGFGRSKIMAAENILLNEEIDRLGEELATAWKASESQIICEGSELYWQVERAAGELPIGWEIRICVERDAGYAELWDQDGCEVDFPNSCETLALTVSDAIDHAKEASHE